jgi:hypothetical protein
MVVRRLEGADRVAVVGEGDAGLLGPRRSGGIRRAGDGKEGEEERLQFAACSTTPLNRR